MGKIKNTEGSARSVGSVAVQFQYGLYVVGHLSKLAFHFMFKVICLVVVVSSVRLACNFLSTKPFLLFIIYSGSIFQPPTHPKYMFFVRTYPSSIVLQKENRIFLLNSLWSYCQLTFQPCDWF